MPIVKCQYCQREYEVLEVIHDCPKRKNAAVSEEEIKEWEQKSFLMKFFGYPPGTPSLLRVVSSSFVVAAAGGLSAIALGALVLIWGLFSEKAIWDAPGSILLIVYGAVVFLAASIMSYGIVHRKKWAIFVYSAYMLILLGLSFFLGEVLISILGVLVFLALFLSRRQFIY